jgi:predicted nucleic acid-binding protein
MPLIPEQLIPDANILFSFFKLDSIRRNAFKELLKKECNFICPSYTLKELLNDKEKIKKYAGIDEFEFSYLIQLLNKELNIISIEKYKDFLLKAEEISPHKKDNAYFALALSLGIQIWSDEKLFQNQSKIKVYPTEELLEILK